MSLNSHGLPSRVPAIAEIGRLLGDPDAADEDKCAALQLLVQDHADLDEVEAQAALWAMAQIQAPAAEHESAQQSTQQAQQALLTCAPQWLKAGDTALLCLDCYQTLFGPRREEEAGVLLALLEIKALKDSELAQRLALLA